MMFTLLLLANGLVYARIESSFPPPNPKFQFDSEPIHKPPVFSTKSNQDVRINSWFYPPGPRFSDSKSIPKPPVFSTESNQDIRIKSWFYPPGPRFQSDSKQNP
ncbi:unnamed protein product [Microthlaspi erraticum]|uniref:Uncharacterized protein n=1 Tax=Microthlaspi erraticum TaxID=1685480 RepID=A0A6D2JJN3_9BRAS|nr:unnamed protein product [Microthlaspi erraticum]